MYCTLGLTHMNVILESFSLLQPFSAHQNQAATASSSGDPLTDAPGNHKPHPPHEGKKVSSKKRNISRSPSPSGGGDHPKKRRTSRDSNGSDNEKKMGEPSIFTFDTSQMHPLPAHDAPSAYSGRGHPRGGYDDRSDLAGGGRGVKGRNPGRPLPGGGGAGEDGERRDGRGGAGR